MKAFCMTENSQSVSQLIHLSDPFPLLISIEKSRYLLGDIARSTVYELIKRKELESVKIGTRNLITFASIKRLLEGSAHND